MLSLPPSQFGNYSLWVVMYAWGFESRQCVGLHEALGAAFFTLEDVAHRRFQLHLVWIYYFCLFFKVKCITMVFGKGSFFYECFAIVRIYLLWVCVANEAVRATSAVLLARTRIPKLL